MIEKIIIVALAGALIGLDVTVLGQWMISRPLVSGTIIGTLLGDPWQGFKVGVIIELLWIDVIPVGVAIPLDASVVAILSSAWYMLSNHVSMAAVVLGILFAIPVGIFFKVIDVEMRKSNIFLVHIVDAWINEAKEKRISWLIFGGILFTFSRSFVFYLIILYPGLWLIVFLLNHLPTEMLQGLRLAAQILPLLGIVIALKSIHFNPLDTFTLYRTTMQKKKVC